MDTKIRDNSGDYIVNFDFTPDSMHIVFDYSCSINRMNLDGSGATAQHRLARRPGTARSTESARRSELRS
jgi:hypothetical protein